MQANTSKCKQIQRIQANTSKSKQMQANASKCKQIQTTASMLANSNKCEQMQAIRMETLENNLKLKEIDGKSGPHRINKLSILKVY